MATPKSYMLRPTNPDDLKTLSDIERSVLKMFHLAAKKNFNIAHEPY